ncbi:MAG: site-2 protease family protein [Anaerolineae bacterium]
MYSPLFSLLGGRLSLDVFIAFVVGLTLGMTVHEFAHNYGAYVMGDASPKYNGRLTLNPLVHIYWPGWIMWMVIGFGILGTAPISPERLPMYNRRWRWLVAVAAGPVSNLILAAIIGIAVQLMGANPLTTIYTMASTMIYINVLLFVFNLIPLFPIDGWQIVYCLLPPDLAVVWRRYQQESGYVFMGLILLSFVVPQLNILGYLIGGPVNTISRLLLGG